MSLINFIAKTIFYVTAILTPIIFFKAAPNPTTIINLSNNAVLMCTLGSIECIQLIEGGKVLFDPYPKVAETILTLSSINIPELINASDIQIMLKIASLNDVELKNFSNLVKLPDKIWISENTRNFFINSLRIEFNTKTSSKINESSARINALLDYYLINRNNSINGFNLNENFLKMLEWDVKLSKTNSTITPRIFEAAINNNIEPFPGYNELESMKDINVKLREEIVNNDKFSSKLQQAAKNSHESISDNLKKSKNNMWPIYFIICITTMLTSELIMAFTQ